MVITHHQGNANQIHNEILPHTCQNDYYEKRQQIRSVDEDVEKREHSCNVFFFWFFLWGFFWVFLWGFFCFFRATLMTHGSSQVRGWIRIAAVGLQYSHSDAESELCLQPTPQLMATLDP